MFVRKLWWSIHLLFDPKNVSSNHSFSWRILLSFVTFKLSKDKQSDLATEYVCVFIYIINIVSFTFSCVEHLLIKDTVSNEISTKDDVSTK